ncbi:Cytochrome [Forsythia ovata]|uniref:Cytochrome n=1 Tax=Forsythia ovata TaxID=205694 RepID=A0ABD1SAQ3_9LAMI
MKEILTKHGLFQKPHPDPIRGTIVGGLLFLENEKWTKNRKIINPAFHIEKLKNTVDLELLKEILPKPGSLRSLFGKIIDKARSSLIPSVVQQKVKGAFSTKVNKSLNQFPNK